MKSVTFNPKKSLLFYGAVFAMLFCLLFSANGLTASAKTLPVVTGTLSSVKKAPKVSGRFVTKKGKKYFRLSSGGYAKNTWICYKKNYYYINRLGQMQKGWMLYNNRKYFLSKKGPMLMGWQKISGSWYCFTSAGYLNTSISASQYLLVRTAGYRAKVTMLQQTEDGKWQQLLSTSGYVGRNGVKKKIGEGDGITPKGTYTFGSAFGVNPNPGTLRSYTQVDESHYWVDDPNSNYYNQFVSTRNVTKDWNSAEHLCDYKQAYAYSLAVNFNTKCKPGKGSAIFLHCSTGGPTAGCISVPEKAMIQILRRIKGDAKISIA